MIASVVGEGADELREFQRAERVVVLFGNEAQGLRTDEVALCDRRVTIPMKWGTDSLNVSVAAGIVLFDWKRRTGYFRPAASTD